MLWPEVEREVVDLGWHQCCIRDSLVLPESLGL